MVKTGIVVDSIATLIQEHLERIHIIDVAAERGVSILVVGEGTVDVGAQGEVVEQLVGDARVDFKQVVLVALLVRGVAACVTSR